MLNDLYIGISVHLCSLHTDSDTVTIQIIIAKIIVFIFINY